MSTRSDCIYVSGLLPGETRQLASVGPWMFLLLLHVPLGLLLHRVPEAGAAHGLLVFGYGLYVSVTGQSNRVAYVSAYLAGAEVLWRMTGSGVFWEFGKYAIVILFLVFIVRNSKWRHSPMALMYFALLLPSCVITLTAMELDEARKQISFNLSGPLALAVSVYFFSNIRLSTEELCRFLLSFITPLMSIASITIWSTYFSGPVVFGTNSNFASSGGFGPNQVASSLGLGVLFGVLVLLLAHRLSLVERFLLLVTVVLCGIQSAMTFSRSGLMMAALAGCLGAVFLLRDPRVRTRIVVCCLAAYATANYLIVPELDSFTGGALSHRFQSTNLSHRDDLALADVAIWLENPVVGSGPGVAKSIRSSMTHSSSIAHTEFTRLLSDHGLFGLAALGMLLALSLHSFGATPSGARRAFVVTMVSWSLIYLALNGMRLAAPSLLFGLGMVRWVDSGGGEQIVQIACDADGELLAEEGVV